MQQALPAAAPLQLWRGRIFVSPASNCIGTRPKEWRLYLAKRKIRALRGPESFSAKTCCTFAIFFEKNSSYRLSAFIAVAGQQRGFDGACQKKYPSSSTSDLFYSRRRRLHSAINARGTDHNRLSQSARGVAQANGLPRHIRRGDEKCNWR